jgi:iron complex outermembrane receptor protein
MKTTLNPVSSSIKLILASALTVSLSAGAQEASANGAKENVEQIAVVGTRAAPRSVGDSAVPLDIIGIDELSSQGDTDVLNMMKNVVPSLMVNDQPISDAASLVRPFNLRGMSPDHTLVLVNGKRRHRSAVISFLGGGLADGAQGPDISAIPASALKQIEVLRDGAAAQYGSDAIAGVVNFVLNDADEGGFLEARYGSFMEGDGDTFQLQGNVGLPLGKVGFANLAMEYREQDPTSRSVQRPDAQGLIDAGNTAVSDVTWDKDAAQIWGTPEIKSDLKLSGNFGIDLGNDQELYAFTNMSEREVEGGFFFRNPHSRGGVFTGPSLSLENGAYVPDADGAIKSIKVLDIDGLNNGVACNPLPIVDGNILDDASFAAISATDTAYGQNCFVFNEILPGGFNPQFGAIVKDTALAVGLKGETDSEWLYDFSVSFGNSKVEYAISQTINPSLGPDTPMSFKPGTAVQADRNVNADFSKMYDDYSLAWGVEWRSETFEQRIVDSLSAKVGPYAAQGFGIGSNGFPGFQPSAAGEWTRTNIAGYVDVEYDVSDDLMVSGALRYENFSDFGGAVNGKVAGRYQLTDEIAFRGAASTGFKAPTTGQNNVINVTTAFSGGVLADEATLAPTNPIAELKGAVPLTPEESVNMSFGVVGEFDNGLYVTVDFYSIEVTDRLAIGDKFLLSDADIANLQAQGVADASSFTSVKYYTNNFDTTTKGVDIVANYSFDLGSIETKVAFAANFNNIIVDSGDLSATRVGQLQANLPEKRGTFTVSQKYTDDLSATYRVNHHGDYYEWHLDDADGLFNPSAETTIDAEVSYQIDDNLKVSVGAQNLLDERPTENPYSDWVGSKYPTTAPFGINGGFYYLRANYQF